MNALCKTDVLLRSAALYVELIGPFVILRIPVPGRIGEEYLIAGLQLRSAQIDRLSIGVQTGV